MSDFLREFAGLLSHAPRDASVARTWSNLLPLVSSYAGSEWSKGGLWLFDRHDDHGHLTLWHWWALHPTAGAPAPQHVTSVTRHDARNLSPAELAAQLRPTLLRLEQMGILEPGASASVSPIVAHDVVAGTEQSETIGFLALFAERGPTEMPAAFRSELQVACSLVGAWMNLNREWRKASALAEFQKSQNLGHDTEALALSAADQLRDFASARVAAAIYVPVTGELRRIGYRGLAETSAKIDRNAFVHRFHFGDINGFRRVENRDEVQIEFDAEGRFVAPESTSPLISLAEFPEIQLRGQPVSILVARIKDAPGNGRDADGPPPIATLLMATSADRDFLGGRFSDTNRAVMRLILDAFRNSYSLSLQRDRMEQLAVEFESIAKTRTEIDINDDARDQVDFVRFARLTRETLPNIADAAISNVNHDGVLQNCWRADGRTDAPCDWLQPRRPDHPVPWEGNPARWVWSRRIEETIGGGAIWLDLLMTAHALPVIERTLLERIIAELRIEQRLHVNKDDWAQQLAEVRHNMRAVLASVIGKVELLSDRYESAIRNRDSQEVFQRLVVEKPFRKNIRDLDHAGKELEVIFENIRALVGKLDENSLQLTNFDLPQLIRSTLSVLEVEAERRGLVFHFVDTTQQETRRVVADSIWTRIALFNLFENAIKYSDRANEIDVILNVRSGHWQLRVVNTGRYIPPNMREKIFEPYQRVRHAPGLQAMPGTGLGLMTVRRYVQLHQHRDIPVPTRGGPIVVESEPIERQPSGAVVRARTSFTISVPRRGPVRNG